MTHEQISDIVQKKGNSTFDIKFKTRNTIKGLFIKTADFNELSRKNLWRIVSEGHIAAYKNSKDENLARIFNGAEFIKLEVSSS